MTNPNDPTVDATGLYTFMHDAPEEDNATVDDNALADDAPEHTAPGTRSGFYAYTIISINPASIANKRIQSQRIVLSFYRVDTDGEIHEINRFSSSLTGVFSSSTDISSSLQVTPERRDALFH